MYPLDQMEKAPWKVRENEIGRRAKKTSTKRPKLEYTTEHKVSSSPLEEVDWMEKIEDLVSVFWKQAIKVTLIVENILQWMGGLKEPFDFG